MCLAAYLTGSSMAQYVDFFRDHYPLCVVIIWMFSLAELASNQNSEEKLNHEAEELEKRLSMLSHGSSTGRIIYSSYLMWSHSMWD